MIHLTPRDYAVMPWKNGGGTTTEILIRPEGARLGQPFRFRVSVADVASSGPFSTFPGYERHLVLVAGPGMTLALPDRTLELRPFEPVTFSGDDRAEGTLASGPVRDFNLIVDRARAKGSLACERVDGTLTIAGGDAETCIVHVLEGRLGAAGTGDTLVTDAPLVLTGEARIVVARVRE